MPGAKTRTVLVPNSQGVHARPSSQIVEVTNRFEASVQLSAGGRVADASSILAVMMLGAPGGAEIELRAEGPEAEEALAALVALIDSGFGER